MNNLNWEWLQSFTAVVAKGSLSQAARHLGLSQPTLSRHIQQLEKQLELQLFQRTSKGLTLTSDGQKLMASTQVMEQAATELSRQAKGLSESLSGILRVSASEVIGTYDLPQALVVFHKENPKVQFEIVISNQESNLFTREADVAVRMFQPTQMDLVAQRLPSIELGFFAHEKYLEEHGEPQSSDPDPFGNNIWIGYDKSDLLIKEASLMGFSPQHKQFSFRSDHMLTQIALARAGGGIIVTHAHIAQDWPGMVQIMKDVELRPLPFYLVCHQDTQHNRLIRKFTAFLKTWFKT